MTKDEFLLTPNHFPSSGCRLTPCMVLGDRGSELCGFFPTLAAPLLEGDLGEVAVARHALLGTGWSARTGAAVRAILEELPGTVDRV